MVSLRQNFYLSDNKWKRFLLTLFLISVSIFIFGIIYIAFGHMSNIYDLATLWSAVYGTVLGTVGFYKTLDY